MAYYDAGLLLASIINIAVYIGAFGACVWLKSKFKRHFRKRLYNRLQEHPSDPSPDDPWFPVKWFRSGDLIRKCGGDGAMLVLVNKCMLIFFLIYVPFGSALIGINVSDDYGYWYFKHNPPENSLFVWTNGIQEWSIVNITPGSQLLYAHFAISLLFDIGVWVLVWQIFRYYVIVLSDCCTEPAMLRTVMVSNSKPLTSSQEWAESNVNGSGIELSSIVRVNIPREEPKNMKKLVRQRTHLMEELDAIQYTNSVKQANQSGTLLKNPKKWVPKKCKRVDAVEYYRSELHKVEEQLAPKLEAFPSSPPAGVVFVTFETSRLALEFLKHIQAKASLITGAFAPVPSEIRWESLNQSVKKWIVDIVVLVIFAFMLFTWAIPVGFLSSFENYRNIDGPIGDFVNKAIDKLGEQLIGLISGYLPLIVVGLFGVVLKLIIEKMVGFQDPPTDGMFHSMAFRKLFTFNLCAYIFFQAVFSGGIQAIIDLQHLTYQKTLQMISRSISPTLPLFPVILLNGAGIAGAAWLLQPGPLLLSFLKSRFIPSSEPVRLHKAWTPPPFKFWQEYANLFFGCCIGLLLGVTVPLVGILTTLFLLSRYLVCQYLMTEFYPYQPTSQLRIVHSVLHAILFTNDLRQIGMMGIFSAKEREIFTVLYIPFVIMSIGYHIYIWIRVRNTRNPFRGNPPPFIKKDTLDTPCTDENLGEAYQHPFEAIDLGTQGLHGVSIDGQTAPKTPATDVESPSPSPTVPSQELSVGQKTSDTTATERKHVWSDPEKKYQET